MGNLTLCAKQAGLLFLAGFKEACCLHRVFQLCISSRMLSIRTGQCFLLNGFIFLGSLSMLKSVVIPALLWILPSQCEHPCGSKAAVTLYAILRFILIKLFYDNVAIFGSRLLAFILVAEVWVLFIFYISKGLTILPLLDLWLIFWFYPLYVFSIVLSNIWYNDIAKHAFDAVRRLGLSTMQAPITNDSSDSQRATDEGRPSGFEGVILGIGEQVYSILLLAIFLIEVILTGFIPFVGKATNFMLLSWMYAYYCFEYKWNLSELSLDKRLDFFESNWPFFLGFGSPCVLAIFFFSPLVSYGVMAILFPLFVLTAAGTQAEQVIESTRRSWEGTGPGKLQIFYAAHKISMMVLQFFPKAQKEQ